MHTPRLDLLLAGGVDTKAEGDMEGLGEEWLVGEGTEQRHNLHGLLVLFKCMLYNIRCTEEAHRPVNCETVSKWILKNSAESENMNWILANSKPCPKCQRPIEKNQGCMHMTCTPPCKFEFCWLCCGSWAEHGERTGGFYACNRYESANVLLYSADPLPI